MTEKETFTATSDVNTGELSVQFSKGEEMVMYAAGQSHVNQGQFPASQTVKDMNTALSLYGNAFRKMPKPANSR